MTTGAQRGDFEIADGASNPRKLATAALKVDELAFPRWYA